LNKSLAALHIGDLIIRVTSSKPYRLNEFRANYLIRIGTFTLFNFLKNEGFMQKPLSTLHNP